MTILKKRLAVIALGLATTALASPSYAQGANQPLGQGADRNINGAFDPTTILAPPMPQATLGNPIPAPLLAPAQPSTINEPTSLPAFRGLTGIGQQ
jgi:hypothetical protein